MSGDKKNKKNKNDWNVNDASQSYREYIKQMLFQNSN